MRISKCILIAMCLSLTGPFCAVAQRSKYLLDYSWRFNLGDAAPTTCTNSSFPIDLHDQQCLGLTSAAQYADADGCRDGCCGDDSCEVWQWCPENATGCSPQKSCWLGKKGTCHAVKGWVSGGRTVAPTPAPSPGNNCTKAYCKPGYDDSAWRSLDLPHDFVVEGTFSSSASDKSHGFLPYNTGWYRRNFTSPAPNSANDDDTRRSVWLEFEGIQRNSQVWLNGRSLGVHESGYTSFNYDISSLLRPAGEENTLAVYVDATKPDGWWYDGGGIYRHVWMHVTDALHVAPWGVYANASVFGTIKSGSVMSARVQAEATVVNAGTTGADFTVMHTVLDQSGKAVSSASSEKVSLAAGTNTTVITLVDIQKRVSLWSDTSPTLYVLRTDIFRSTSSSSLVGTSIDAVDTVSTRFGFRRMEWDADKGFILNGIPTKIRGLANHQDFAGVGVAVPDSLQKFRVSKLKEMGANGWRTAHNPPNPALLDTCDEMGFLVWDENHRNEVSGQYISDLKSLLLRDRNHPSVVMWSLCNEALCEGFNADHAKTLYPIVKQFDQTRPVTAAMNGGYGDDFSNVLDVMGFNYHVSSYDSYHKSHPSTRLIGSETASALSDRGEYANNSTLAYMSAYDVNAPGWGNTAEAAWQPIATRDFISGTFIWTGFDYKGEPTPYAWPNVNSHFGIIDIAGFPKDTFHYYKTWWASEDRDNTSYTYVFPHWNWDEGNCRAGSMCTPDPQTGTPKTVQVWAYSNAHSVSLFVNGESVVPSDENHRIGKTNRITSPAYGHVQWPAVAYAPGSLEVRGYDEGGAQVSSHTVHTAGSAASLKITIEQGTTVTANKDDVALIKIAVVDVHGYLVPTASNNITFTLSGPATLIGVGNGDPSSHEPDKSTHRSAFNGLARAILQATDKAGTISLTAASSGLTSATVKIISSTARDQIATL